MIDDDGRDINLFRQVPSMDSIEYTKRQMDDLESHLRALPPVDEQGRSECSFAKELYERKENEFEPKLEEAINSLHEDIREVSMHIDRVKENMNEIQNKASFLNLDEPKEKYDQAIKFCQQLISELTVQLERGKQILLDAENVLDRSRMTVWPGQKIPKSRKKNIPAKVLSPSNRNKPNITPKATQKDYSGLIGLDAENSSNALPGSVDNEFPLFDM
jgi:predicted  nucleic acid-binding Zn-ribbon protein